MSHNQKPYPANSSNSQNPQGSFNPEVAQENDSQIQQLSPEAPKSISLTDLIQKYKKTIQSRTEDPQKNQSQAAEKSNPKPPRAGPTAQSHSPLSESEYIPDKAQNEENIINFPPHSHALSNENPIGHNEGNYSFRTDTDTGAEKYNADISDKRHKFSQNPRRPRQQQVFDFTYDPSLVRGHSGDTLNSTQIEQDIIDSLISGRKVRTFFLDILDTVLNSEGEIDPHITVKSAIESILNIQDMSDLHTIFPMLKEEVNLFQCSASRILSSNSQKKLCADLYLRLISSIESIEFSINSPVAQCEELVAALKLISDTSVDELIDNLELNIINLGIKDPDEIVLESADDINELIKSATEVIISISNSQIPYSVKASLIRSLVSIKMVLLNSRYLSIRSLNDYIGSTVMNGSLIKPTDSLISSSLRKFIDKALSIARRLYKDIARLELDSVNLGLLKFRPGRD